MCAVKFSVVIPTRERAETLRFALRTCLDQTFDDYEIIVSDNCSSPATKQVVSEAHSPKIRYLRTPQPLAMSDNWEFGLSHARGEYILIVGDDDALLPHALAELARLVHDWNAKVIRWTAAYYTWPTLAIAGQGDFLRLPLGRGLCERDSAATIREVVAFREFYTSLPMLYNAAVHRNVLDELRRRTGRVIPHAIPDVYSGFAIAYAAGKFLSTNVPMSVSGQSAASNGVATLFNRGHTEIDREFFALNAKAGLRCESTVPDLPVFPHVPVADSFAFAKRVLFPELPVELDRKELTRACVSGARVSESDWPSALATIRASLADVPQLQRWFDQELAATSYPGPIPPMLRLDRLGIDGTFLNLDAAAFGIRDVAAAARLCEQLLNYRDQRIIYSHANDDALVAAKKIAELRYSCEALRESCDERDMAILRLHLGSEQMQQTITRLETRCSQQGQIVERTESQLRELDRRLRRERRFSLLRPLRLVKRALTALGLLSRRLPK